MSAVSLDGFKIGSANEICSDVAYDLDSEVLGYRIQTRFFVSQLRSRWGIRIDINQVGVSSFAGRVQDWFGERDLQ